jgi:hypothetical protein
MALGGLAEVVGGRGGCASAVDYNGWQLIYVTVFIHPKLACRSIQAHDAVSILIDPTFAATELGQGLDIATPEAIPIKSIVVLAAVINIVISSSFCCCY